MLRSGLLLVLLVLSSLHLCHAQDLNALYQQLSSAKTEPEKASVLEQIVQTHLLQANHDKALVYGEQYFASASKAELPDKRAKSLLFLGQACRGQKNYSSSLNYLVQSGIQFEQLGKEAEQAAVCDELGFLFQDWKAYDKSIQNFSKSVQIKQKLKDEEGLAKTQKALANVYYQKGDGQKSLDTYQPIASYYEKTGNLQALTKIYAAMSVTAKGAGQYSTALAFSEKALALQTKAGDLEGQANTLNNIGYLHKQLGNKEKSVESFEKASRLYKELLAKSSSSSKKNAVIYLNTGVAYSNAGQYKTANTYFEEALKLGKQNADKRQEANALNYLSANALAQKNTSDASEHVQNAILLENELKANDLLSVSYKILSEIQQQEGDFKQSKNSYMKHLEYKELHEEQERNEMAALVQSQIEAEKKENELMLFLAEKEKQELMIKQLELEADKRQKDIALKQQDLEIKDQQLQLFKKEKEIQEKNFANQLLEKQRVQQELAIAQQRLEAEKRNQEITELQRTQQIQELKEKENQQEREKLLAQNELSKKEKEMSETRLSDQKRFQLWVISLATLVIGVILFAFIKNRKKNKKLEQKNSEINKQQQEIAEKNKELLSNEEELRQNMEELQATQEVIITQKTTLENTLSDLEIKNKNIMDSIRYAQTIQNAILPYEGLLLASFRSFFALYLPKDVVSGDFYWHAKKGEVDYIAVVDCTGHGVPGAFMSLIGHSILNEIINSNESLDTNQILEELNLRLKAVLNQNVKDTKSTDGMDLVICKISGARNGKRKVQFTGARRPLVYVDAETNTFNELAGDRKSIGGGAQTADQEFFSKEELDLALGSRLILFSDGIIDQNNSDRKKFGKSNLYSFIESFKDEDLGLLKVTLSAKLQEFMKNSLQRDDITVFAVEL